MGIEDQIQFNKYGQSLISIQELTGKFNLLNEAEKKALLNDILFLIQQSKAKDEDIQPAIEESGLKPSYTPCVLLQKGVNSSNLQRIINLPEQESHKGFLLLTSLFKIAYKRRFAVERGNPAKWWYWDLSDSKNLVVILDGRR